MNIITYKIKKETMQKIPAFTLNSLELTSPLGLTFSSTPQLIKIYAKQRIELADTP
ncbi:MAG: hypothetical protein R6V40_04305 [Candidatus Moraniibacteriota bacterium]